MTIIVAEPWVYEEESRREESVCRCEDTSTGISPSEKRQEGEIGKSRDMVAAEAH
jgi:hypothetical protein